MRGTGSVYRRERTSPSGQRYVRWMAQVRLGDGRYMRRVYVTRGEATKALTAMLASTEVSRQPLGAYLRSWLAETAAHRVTPNTLRGYRAAVAHLAPIEDIPLEDLTAEDVERVVNRMTARRHKQTAETVKAASPKTRRNALAMLRAALGDAERRGHLTRNVATMVDMPRVPRTKPPTMTTERAHAILAAVAGDRYEAAYALGLCGMRASEILGLVWSDVDMDAGVIALRYQLVGSGPRARRVQLKTRSSEAPVLLPSFVVTRLRAHKRAQDAERPVTPIDGDGHVFVTPAGWTVNGSWLTKHFQALLEAAKLPTMRLHDLRHGTASLLAGIGVHPSVAQAILRHSTAKVSLDLYTSVTTGMQREAMDRLSEAIG